MSEGGRGREEGEGEGEGEGGREGGREEVREGGGEGEREGGKEGGREGRMHDVECRVWDWCTFCIHDIIRIKSPQQNIMSIRELPAA